MEDIKNRCKYDTQKITFITGKISLILAVLKQINSYSCCLIVALKRKKYLPSSANPPNMGPGSSQVVLVGLMTQTDWIEFITVFILIVFKIFGSSKLNNFSFYQNHIIKNPILLCKYFSLSLIFLGHPV